MLNNHINNLQSQVIKGIEKELEFISTSSNLNNSLWNLYTLHKNTNHAGRIQHLIDCCNHHNNPDNRRQISGIICGINDENILNNFLTFLNPSQTETDIRLSGIEKRLSNIELKLLHIENINIDQNTLIIQIDENIR